MDLKQISTDIKARLSKAVANVKREGDTPEDEEGFDPDFERLPGKSGSWSKSLGASSSVPSRLGEWDLSSDGSASSCQLHEILGSLRDHFNGAFSFITVGNSLRLVVDGNPEKEDLQGDPQQDIEEVSQSTKGKVETFGSEGNKGIALKNEEEDILIATPIAKEVPEGVDDVKNQEEDDPDYEGEINEEEQGHLDDLIFDLAEGITFKKKKGTGKTVIVPSKQELVKLKAILMEYEGWDYELAVDEILKMRKCLQRIRALYVTES